MKLNSKILVLYSGVYDIEQEKGDNVRGCSLHYLFVGDDANGFESVHDKSRGNTAGMQRAKCSLPYDIFDQKITYVPGVYDALFEMTTGSDGKPVMKCVDLNFFSRCRLELVSDKPVVDPTAIGGLDTAAAAPKTKK